MHSKGKQIAKFVAVVCHTDNPRKKNVEGRYCRLFRVRRSTSRTKAARFLQNIRIGHIGNKIGGKERQRAKKKTENISHMYRKIMIATMESNKTKILANFPNETLPGIKKNGTEKRGK